MSTVKITKEQIEDVKTINSNDIFGAGDLVIDKTSVGLGNVDNTSDANKPISTATAAALSGKATADGTSSELIQGDGNKVAKSSVVRNTTVGTPTEVDSAIVSTDSVNIAFGKAQGQINARARLVGTSDIEITDTTKGVILKSPDGTRYRITVANGGTLVVTAV